MMERFACMDANALPWDDLRVVLAIGHTGTLGGAAQALGLNHSTLFRRLGTLEQRLGVRLFERSREGYSPTPAGEAMLALAERIDRDVTALGLRLAGADLRPSGTVRVTTTDSLMAGVLPPILADFHQSCPEIRLDLVVSTAFLNLSRRDADVAIRPAAAAPEHLVGRRLCGVKFGIYAATDTIAPVASVESLTGCRWVGPDDSLSHTVMARWLAETLPEVRMACRANTLLALRDAAAAGIGLVVLPYYLGDTAPGLSRVLAPVPGLATSLWLLTHPDLRQVARVRAVLDHFGPALTAARALIEGP